MPASAAAPPFVAPPFLSPHAPAATLEIALLGTFGVRHGAQPLPLRLPNQALRLLAFLLLSRGRTLAREHVAFTLWPDDDEAGARANLRRKLHLLVRALPAAGTPWIISSPTTVGWNEAARYRLDVAAFESLCAGRATEEADAWYTGDMLAGFDDDWIVRERDRLRALATDNLSGLVAEHRRRRDYGNAIRFARRLHAIDPWREDGIRSLIALRFEAGDRAGALAEYERFRTALAAEIGVEPMPETVCVYERVLAQTEDVGPDTRGVGTVAGLGTAAGLATGLPFVGRARELAALRAAWQRAADGAGGAMLIAGEAGIGKTRLIDEFAAFAAGNGGRVLRGGTTPFEVAPYQAFSEALGTALPLVRDAGVEPLWLAVLATLIPQLGVALPKLPALAALDAESERTRLFEAVEAALGALCAARPVVLLLEDLHWSGAATVALLDHVARRAGGRRLLTIASYREDDLSRAHPLRAARRRLEREGLLSVSALGPLDTPAIEHIVAQLTDAPPAGRTAVARYLRDASDGNPFYLGELIANDRESGALDAARRSWDVPAAAEPSRALTATLSARLERLSPAARTVAQIAAVVGRAFSAELVREVGGIGERATLDGLEELVERRLIRSTGGPGGDYSFSHQLIVAAIAAELTPQARRRHHRHIGNVIAEIYADRVEQHSAELATHFERGGEAERAARFGCIAARHALALYANSEAAALAGHACDLSANPATRFAALAIVEEAARRLGDRGAQRTSIARLEALAATAGDRELQREALRRRIVLAHDRGDRDDERTALAALEAQVAAAPAPWPAAVAQLKGSYLTATGAYREARVALTGARSAAGNQHDPRIEVECWCALVELAGFEGRIDDVRAFLDAVPGFEQTYDGMCVVTLLQTACAAAMKIDDHAVLAACAERLLTCSRAIGFREGEAAAYRFAGLAALRLFEIDRARISLERALDMFVSMDQRPKALNTLVDLANLLATIGRFDEAIERFAAADEIATSIAYTFGHVACVNNISYTAYISGDFALARSSARRALDAARLIEAPSALAHALISVGVAERELHEVDSAIAHLEAGVALERKFNATSELGEDLCELILALLRGKRVARAAVLADEVLALVDGAEHPFPQPQYMLWTVAAVRRALGDFPAARALAGRARRALEELQAAIPDAESRAAFRRLRFNRAVDAAYDDDRWTI